MLRYRAKSAFLALERRVNRWRYLGWRRKQSPAEVHALLTYHTLCGGEDIPACLQGETVRERDFTFQLKWLMDRGFDFVSLHELMTGSPRERSVVVTFDDGYAGVFRRAFPWLERYRLRATLFITTDFIHGKIHPPWASMHPELRDAVTQTAPLWKPLSWEEIERMADSKLIEIGSHGCSHRLMGKLSAEEARRELVDSKEELEQRLHRKIHTFSYPFGIGRYGAYGPHLESLLKETGYTAACTGEEGRFSFRGNPFFIPRYPVRFADSARDVECKVMGLTDWSHRCQSYFHRLFPSPHED